MISISFLLLSISASNAVPGHGSSCGNGNFIPRVGLRPVNHRRGGDRERVCLVRRAQLRCCPTCMPNMQVQVALMRSEPGQLGLGAYARQSLQATIAAAVQKRSMASPTLTHPLTLPSRLLLFVPIVLSSPFLHGVQNNSLVGTAARKDRLIYNCLTPITFSFSLSSSRRPDN